MGRIILLGLFAVFCASTLLVSCGGDEGAQPASQAAETKADSIARLEDSKAILEHLDSLPAEEQNEPWALHLRGRALLEPGVGDPSEEVRAEVVELFTRALDGDRRSVPIRIDLAALLSGKGLRVKSIRILEEGRGFAPDESRFCFQIARTYLEAEETEGALKAVNEGLALDPDAAEGHLLAGRILFENTNRKEEGLDRMRRALAADRGLDGGAEILAAALVAWSINQESTGAHDAAFRTIEEALELVPDMPVALLEQGRMLVQRGQLEKGIENLRAFHAGHRDNDGVRSLLAGALKTLGYQRLREGERAEALDLFRETIVLGAPDVDVAVIARIVDQDGRAAGENKPLTDEEMAEARELFERGSALLQEGKGAEALAALEESLALVPNNPFARHQIGVAHAMEGSLEKAEAEFEKAIEAAQAMELDLPAAYVKLAEVVFRLGKTDDARLWLDRHDAAYPDSSGDPRVTSLRSLLDG